MQLDRASDWLIDGGFDAVSVLSLPRVASEQMSWDALERRGPGSQAGLKGGLCLYTKGQTSIG